MPDGPLRSGVKTVAATGTAERLVSAVTLVTYLRVRGITGNTNDAYIGDENVSTSDAPIDASQDVVVASSDGFDLREVWVDVDTNGEGVNFWYLLK